MNRTATQMPSQQADTIKEGELRAFERKKSRREKRGKQEHVTQNEPGICAILFGLRSYTKRKDRRLVGNPQTEIERHLDGSLKTARFLDEAILDSSSVPFF